MSLMTRSSSRQRIAKISVHQASNSTLQTKPSAAKGRKVTHPQPSPNSDTSDDGNSSTSDYDGLDEHQVELKKKERQKRRKARYQRRYYKRNKAEQQAKGRERAARNRALARVTWNPSSRIEGDVDGQPSHGLALVPADSGLPTRNGSSSPILRAQSFDNFPPLFFIDTIDHGDHANTSHDNQDREMIEFLKHDVRGRLAFTRRMLLNLEADWGTVDQWPVMFVRDWACVKGGGKEVVYDWFSKVRKILGNGRRAITYVTRLMEGAELSSVDECRDLFLEAQHLSANLYTGVLGLEHRLDWAIEQYHLPARSH